MGAMSNLANLAIAVLISAMAPASAMAKAGNPSMAGDPDRRVGDAACSPGQAGNRAENQPAVRIAGPGPAGSAEGPSYYLVFQPEAGPAISPLAARTLDLAIAAQKSAPTARLRILSPADPERTFAPMLELINNYLIQHGVSADLAVSRDAAEARPSGDSNRAGSGAEAACSL